MEDCTVLVLLLVCLARHSHASGPAPASSSDPALALLDPPDPEDQCQKLLERFSNSSAQFTRCANQYAKPIFMCRNCVHDFVAVRTYYYSLEHSHSEGINCKDLLTSHDRVEIIQATYDYIVSKPDGLWERGYCSSCYTSPLNHTSNLTADAQTFFELFQNVNDCFQAHPNPNASSATVRRSEACTECASDYFSLLGFYKERFLARQFPYLNGICFDILDAMNTTQHRWGTGRYHCGRHLQGSAPLLLAVCLVLLSPPAFYVGVRWGPGSRTSHERIVSQHHIQQSVQHHVQQAVLEAEQSGQPGRVT